MYPMHLTASMVLAANVLTVSLLVGTVLLLYFLARRSAQSPGEYNA